MWKLGDGVNSFVSPGKQSNMKSLGATQTMLRKFEVVSEQLYDGIGYSHGEFVLSLLSSTQIKI